MSRGSFLTTGLRRMHSSLWRRSSAIKNGAWPEKHRPPRSGARRPGRTQLDDGSAVKQAAGHFGEILAGKPKAFAGCRDIHLPQRLLDVDQSLEAPDGSNKHVGHPSFPNEGRTWCDLPGRATSHPEAEPCVRRRHNCKICHLRPMPKRHRGRARHCGFGKRWISL